MKTIPIFRNSSGLNTVNDPVRIRFDPRTATIDLSEAVNVVVDQTGMISRRDGYVPIYHNCHSLFCDGYDCLFVYGTTMFRLMPDETRVVVKEDIVPDVRIDYAQVNKDIYFVSEAQYGIVRNGGIYEEWKALPYVGPTTNRTFSGPMPARHIAYFAGRIFLSIDNTIIFSEPFGLSWFDLARNFIILDSNVRMMKPMDTGMYISSDTKTYFLKGTDPKEWVLLNVLEYPAIEWSAAIDYINGLDIGFQQPGLCALWCSEKGACVGDQNGVVINITRDKVKYPQGKTGASLLRGYNFIQVIK